MAVRKMIECHIPAQTRTPFPASRDFPSRGNKKIGGTGYCVTYDTDSQSRNVLASPLGEEGHEVAKGVQANWIHRGEKRPANPVRRHPAKSVWTVVILIMILDVDVTAAGVSKGEAALFLHDCMLLANTVISSGDACRYGADGKRFNDTLSREISRRNDARTIRGRRFLHSASLRSK